MRLALAEVPSLQRRSPQTKENEVQTTLQGRGDPSIEIAVAS